MLCFRLPVSDDLAYLAAHLRPGDVLDLQAVGWTDPELAVHVSVENSAPGYCLAAEADGRLLCLFGCGPDHQDPGVGVPWLLGTPELAKHGRALTRNARRGLRHLSSVWPVLRNQAAADNSQTLRWLSRLGFKLGPVYRHDSGYDVVAFEMRR